jgi:hypothetical protein
MKKLATGLVGLATLLLILSGCTKKPEPSKTTSSKEKVKTSQSSTKETKEKKVDKKAVEESEQEKNKKLFDALPTEVKLVLYVDTVDSRVKEFPGLDNMGIYYYKEGSDIYANLTSAGKDRPITHFVESDNGVQAVQEVSYDTISEKGDPTFNPATNTAVISKDTLYKTYLQRKADFDKAQSHVEKPTKELYLWFMQALQTTTKTMKNAGGEAGKLTDEELVIASSIENHKDKTAPIASSLNSMYQKWSKIDNGYAMGAIQVNIREESRFRDGNIVSEVSEGGQFNNGSRTATQSISALREKYTPYKENLTFILNYVKLGEDFERQRAEKLSRINGSQDTATSTDSSDSSTVDTTKLTEEQAITWVKNYLIQQGATQEEIDEADFKTKLNDENYLEIDIYTWTPAHQIKTLSFIYRINGDGELQEGTLTSNDWQTVSTTYLG